MPLRALKTALRWLNGTGGGMRSRTLRAGTWMTFLLGMRHPALLVRTFILARILTPQDFGLMAIVLIVTGLVETLGTIGLRSALIQRKTINDDQLNTAWTLEVARGFISAALLLAIAPAVSGFFDTPEAANLIRFAALAPLLIGLSNIGTVWFDRDLDFRKKFLIQFSRTVVDVSLSIVLALMLRDVWALVYGMVAGVAISTVLSYLLVSYKPRPYFNRKEFRVLFGFSSWVMLARYLRELNGNLDFILIGRLVDVATLGLYQMGWRVSFAVTNAFNSIAIPQISFASYSRIQGDRARLLRGYQQTAELVLSIALPFVAGLAIIAPVLTDVVLGQRWAGAVVPMQILAIAAGFRALRSQTTSVLLGIGMSRRVFILDTISTVTLIVGLFVLIPRWEAEGAAWAVMASLLVVIPISIWDVKRHLSTSLVSVLKPLTAPLLLVGSVLVIGLPLREVIEDPGVAGFILISLGIAAGYVGGTFAVYLLLRGGPLSLLRRNVGHEST